MKIFLHTLALTVVLLSALFPAVSAFAYSEQSPVAPAAAFDLPLEPYWKCLPGSTSNGYTSCPDPVEQTPEMKIVGGKTGGGIDTVAELICSTADCPSLAYYIYVDVTIDVAWQYSTNGGCPEWELRVVSSKGFTEYFDEYSYPMSGCGGDPYGPGSTTITYYKAIKKAQFSNWNGTATRLTVQLDNRNNSFTPGTSLQYSFDVSYSFYPAPCDSKYTIIETIADYDIDEILEMPLGPDVVAPDVPDYQKVPIIAGNVYRLETSEGPWRDAPESTTDLYTTEVSFDEGETWIPINQIEFECAVSKYPEPDLMVIYFVAPPETEWFMIRVFDPSVPKYFPDNWLPDELSPMHYKLDLAFLANPACGDKFAYDEQSDWVASIPVQGNDADGVQALYDFTPGDWYLIETAGGPWHDGENLIENRLDGQFVFWSTIGPSFDWNVIDGEGNEGLVDCSEVTDTGYFRAYVQAGGTFLKVRVNDGNETFELNTGALGFNVYKVSYTRPRDLCEAPFQVNDLVKTEEIDAKAENGAYVGQTTVSSGDPLNPLDPLNDLDILNMLGTDRWYMIETKGGPWLDGTDFSYDLSVSVAGEWVELNVWEEAECVTQIDKLGHVRAYFKTPILAGIQYRLRVDDEPGQFGDNSYGMDYDLYTINDNSTGDVPGTCGLTYDEESPLGDITIPANSIEGVNVPAMTQSNYYLLMFDGGPWQESTGQPDEYDVQISDDNGESFVSLGDYGGLVCDRATEDPTVLYYFIEADATKYYKVRVDSESFPDNLGEQHLVVFSAQSTVDDWESCLSGVIKYKVDDFEPIPVNYEPGVRMPLLVGKTYIVALKGGPWNDDTTSSQDAQVTADGEQWFDFKEHPAVSCAVTDLLNKQWIMFVVEQDDLWSIRADDSGDGFDNNYANTPYGYELWTTDPGTGIVDGNDYFIEYCSMGCVRPAFPAMPASPSGVDVSEWLSWVGSYLGGTIEWVGNWIGYSTCNIGVYFAFCPRHTETIISMLNLFETREPIAMYRMSIKVVKAVKEQVDAYNWLNSSGGQGGEGESTIPESVLSADNYVLEGGGDSLQKNITNSAVESFLLPGLPADSPWNSGQITLQGNASYSTACASDMKPVVGNLLSKGVCFASNMLKSTGVAIWMQILFDLSILAGFALYLANVWLKPMTH